MSLGSFGSAARGNSRGPDGSLPHGHRILQQDLGSRILIRALVGWARGPHGTNRRISAESAYLSLKIVGPARD